MYIHKYKFYKDYYRKLKAGSHPQSKTHNLIAIPDDISIYNIKDLKKNLDIDIFEESSKTPLPYFYPIKKNTNYYYNITYRNKIKRGEKLYNDDQLFDSILSQAKEQGYIDIETFEDIEPKDRDNEVFMILKSDKDALDKDANHIPSTLVICDGVWEDANSGPVKWVFSKVYKIVTFDWIIHTYFEKGETDESKKKKSPFSMIHLKPNIKLVPLDIIDADNLNSSIDQVFKIQNRELTLIKK
jgi:hypothetical protein